MSVELYNLRSSMALIIAIAVVGVSSALPVGKTVRYDHIYQGDDFNEVIETFYLRIAADGTASAVSSDGLAVSLSVDDTAGYDEWTVVVGASAFVTPWDGSGELMTVDNGDGREVRLKADGDYARDEREQSFWRIQRLLAFAIGGAMYVFMIAGVRRYGWWF